MSEDKYEHIAPLMELFSRLARLDWRKQTKWSIKASEVRLLIVVKTGNRQEADGNGMTVSDISKLLQVTSPTVTQMINNLIKNDYVKRTVHPNDRRIAEISLTEKGNRVAEEAKTEFTNVFKGLIDHLGKEQSEQLIYLLDQSFAYFKQRKK